MGISYQITFAAGDLSDEITSQVGPLLLKTVQSTAQNAVADWQAAVLKAKLWSVEKERYASSINWKMTGELAARVESDYDLASEIETGRPAKDLKDMLNTSQKVRRTEDGRRFLVIPFRHNTPGNTAHAAAMPSTVYDLVKGIKPTKVTGKGVRPAGQMTHLSPQTGMSASPVQSPYLSNPKTKNAAMVAANKYSWGGKLTKLAMKNAGLDKDIRRKYAGMVKMDTSTPGSKSSSYMTFRVMIESQTNKWIVAPRPGLYIAKQVADEIQPKAAEAFKQALKYVGAG